MNAAYSFMDSQQRNKPPSYQVILKDPNGRWGIMTNPKSGTAQRIRLDPKPFFEARAAAASPISEVLRSPANSTMAMP